MKKTFSPGLAKGSNNQSQLSLREIHQKKSHQEALRRLIMEEEKDEVSLELKKPPRTDSEEDHDGSESKVMIEFGPTMSGSSATFETF